MTLRRTPSTATRVLRQLRHDHRTMGLILLMPTVLMTILYYVFEDNHPLFAHIAPLLLTIIPFTLMFIVTSVAVLRERTSGTLERLLTSPASRTDILLGYSLAFTLLALLQATIASTVTITLLDVAIAGSSLMLVCIAVLAGTLGMSFGLLFSAFAKNEFQAVQFMPAFVLPQFLTCGLFTPRESMAPFLQYFSSIMPITYVVKAAQEVMKSSTVTTTLISSLLVVCGFIFLALALGSATLKSR
jgi:ABC-2 type transport system permease protein